jgi:crotonobetainyl-CoA:carnitine CoA-transferase CaiB-like acyl-CoA transferase
MLKGLRVIEFAEGAAGPTAGCHLVELGADVIKLEPRRGDWLRHAMPKMPGSDMGAAFHALNRGKLSVEMRGDDAAQAAVLQALLKTADIFLCDRPADELKRLGLDAEGDEVFAGNPRLIAVMISPWGRHGPLANYKGSELAAQAMAGYTRYLGHHGEPSRRLGSDMASVGTGIFALQAALAGVHARGTDGKGQRVDVSLLNTLLSLKSIHLAAQSDPDAYEGPRVGGANHEPERGWKTKDGRIYMGFGGSVGADGKKGWVEFVKEVGLHHMLDDPRCDPAGRKTTGHGLYTHDLRATYEAGFAKFTSEELAAIIKKHGGNVAIYIGLDQTMAHPQTAALDIVREVKDDAGKALKVRGYPARFSSLRPAVPANVPACGAHTAAVIGALGLPAAQVKSMLEANGGAAAA